MTDEQRVDPPENEGPPRGTGAMALFRWILVGLMAVAAVGSVAYSFGLVSTNSASAADTQYYCPMHPQVVQDHPGECPICSMSLVPKPSGGKASAAKDEDAKPVSHEGHRHNPSDPYFCPMHPEETGLDASARCPICKMKLEKRAPAAAPSSAPSAAAPSAPNADAHKGHRHNPSDPYACPMHPEETGTSENDRCPICEMKLERRKPQPSGMAEPPAGRPSALPQTVPGLVPLELGPDRVQLIGIRSAPAVSEQLAPELKTVGFVTADESKVARVHSRFSGWIETLAVSTTGQKVRPGQVVASVVNLELLPVQQEFLSARRSSAGASSSNPHAGTTSLSQSFEQDARTRLELFGMSSWEIKRLADTGKPLRTLSVSTPIGGYVTRKNVARGTYIQPGTELFEIADLSKVWVLADIYESEIARVAEGQEAEVTVAAQPGQTLSGKVAYVYPVIDPQTRTMRVRLEFENKDLRLKPGMYGDVVIRLSEAQGVLIPLEAFVDTGDYQYVFLAKEGGRFEPRRVRPGMRSGDKIQVLEGISPGDLVVTTANFLIDSESRLQATIAGASSTDSAAPAAVSSCDADFDKAKFPDKYEQCRQCEIVHRGMGSMVDDCKKAISKPWR